MSAFEQRTNGHVAHQPALLPDGWAMAPLGDVVDVLDSMRVPVNRDERAKRGGTVPYYGATGQAGWIDDFIFDEELVLLGEDGAPFLEGDKAKAYMIRGRSWVNNHAHVLRGRPGLNNAFLLHQLNQVDFRPFVSGTTRLKLPQGPMRQIPLMIAPLPEQQRIVVEIETLFTRLDAAVAALERARANLTRYRQSVLNAAYVGELVRCGTGFARSENPSLETAHHISTELPEGWTWTTLGALLREPLRNGHSAKASGTGRGVRTLALSAVTNRDFSPKNTKLTVADPSRVTNLWLEPGDILIERSNTPELVGTAALYRGDRGFAIFPDLLIRARVVEAVSAPFLEIVLRSDRSRQFFRQRAQGIAGSMPKIDQTAVSSLPVPLPSLPEQHRIVSEVEQRLSLVDAIEATVGANLKRANRMRQSILLKAFAGELVPQNPDDEPASLLLERLREERELEAVERLSKRSRGKKVQYALW